MKKFLFPDNQTRKLAKGLGWFSIGLGAMEVLMPKPLSRFLGMNGKHSLFFAYGLRELLAGIGILSSKNPGPWILSRLGGDGLDIATLAAGMKNNPKKANLAFAIAAVAGVTLLDAICAKRFKK